jgi:hypothetical protein
VPRSLVLVDQSLSGCTIQQNRCLEPDIGGRTSDSCFLERRAKLSPLRAIPNRSSAGLPHRLLGASEIWH